MLSFHTMGHPKHIILAIAALIVVSISTSAISANRISDITNTKHNLSISGPGTVTATTETQICVFCHTPHKAENIPNAPLWNRADYTETYTPYTSSSINANDISATPGGSSKLCLSCHDGTIAIGMVNVLNGQENVTINMNGTDGGLMPGGTYGANSGFTKKLGTDLTNDHPISFTYNTALANADGELWDPAAVSHIGNKSPGVRPLVPLEQDQVQCTSCHDPHIRDVDLSKNIKFLRLNRFQEVAPSGGTFNETNDIVCLACHDKLGQAWAASAHAEQSAANETYTTAAASLREFPANLPVWQASCLNCHDTHTVQGARRLLREGTDSPSSPKSGGNAALEEACYTCHSDDGGVLNGQSGATFEVPDIKTDFALARHMPIETADQANTSTETHDVTNADLIESATKFNNSNRHVECTDCHNPHRVMKNKVFNGTGSTAAGTHDHSEPHNNVASGVLRGAWGVEPSYSAANFTPTNLPSLFTVKSGDGGNGASTAVSNSYVTREYQICFKCHSNYAYGSNPPTLGAITQGNTPFGTNDLEQYTNQAMEFQAPTNHQGSPTSRSDSGAHSNFSANNHRSWHPVMKETGRDVSARGNRGNLSFVSPFSGSTYLGSQTLFCSDCHGTDTSSGVVPNGGENGNPWGPHGSSNNFILKGSWNDDSNDLCLKCHNPTSGGTGFWNSSRDNLHEYHQTKIDTVFRCVYCHISIPHGWKNKAFLVNMNDVGPEVGLAAGTVIPDNQIPYTNGPYYMRAYAKIQSFATSGNWNEGDCGGKDYMISMCQDP